jgi:hypothetical protein
MALSKFCVGCGAEHEKRGYFCTPECHKAFRARKRNERADKFCRLCGRPNRRKREAELLRSAHSTTQESVTCL